MTDKSTTVDPVTSGSAAQVETPNDIGQLAAFLADPGASFITAQLLEASGGYRL